MTIIVLLLAVLAFLSGFLLGFMRAPKTQGAKTYNLKFKSDIDEEYENFLKYDGSEQF